MKRKKSLGTKIERVNGGMLVLTPRDRRLLRRLAQGKTDKAIAIEIGDTEERIAAQRRRITEKLQVRSQDELVAMAERLATGLNNRREVGRATWWRRPRRKTTNE
jgi:DNA-binding CsgD family transcriptional regulator